ncbi:hypothetical protein ElyMa_001765200 [Elysia marginata]|uniref:Uncharacterized protein n=1 Tax=Elysia marginata TaxID=1093978 RepID=A0AAV4ECA9_9GAST|nr:hypothetical protein ElyMa_001765200 [Elysia marginata]
MHSNTQVNCQAWTADLGVPGVPQTQHEIPASPYLSSNHQGRYSVRQADRCAKFVQQYKCLRDQHPRITGCRIGTSDRLDIPPGRPSSRWPRLVEASGATLRDNARPERGKRWNRKTQHFRPVSSSGVGFVITSLSRINNVSGYRKINALNTKVFNSLAKNASLAEINVCLSCRACDTSQVWTLADMAQVSVLPPDAVMSGHSLQPPDGKRYKISGVGEGGQRPPSPAPAPNRVLVCVDCVVNSSTSSVLCLVIIAFALSDILLGL